MKWEWTDDDRAVDVALSQMSETTLTRRLATEMLVLPGGLVPNTRRELRQERLYCLFTGVRHERKYETTPPYGPRLIDVHQGKLGPMFKLAIWLLWPTKAPLSDLVAELKILVERPLYFDHEVLAFCMSLAKGLGIEPHREAQVLEIWIEVLTRDLGCLGEKDEEQLLRILKTKPEAFGCQLLSEMATHLEEGWQSPYRTPKVKPCSERTPKVLDELERAFMKVMRNELHVGPAQLMGAFRELNPKTAGAYRAVSDLLRWGAKPTDIVKHLAEIGMQLLPGTGTDD